MKKKICKHGVDVTFMSNICCKCRYGEKSHLEYIEHSPDLTNEMNYPIGYKLIKGFNMIGDNDV